MKSCNRDLQTTTETHAHRKNIEQLMITVLYFMFHVYTHTATHSVHTYHLLTYNIHTVHIIREVSNVDLILL